MTDPGAVLAELASDPDQVDDISPEDLPHLLAALEALRARLWLRARAPSATEAVGNGAGAVQEREDRLLDAGEVAEVFGVSEDYVYDHASSWPFTRRISTRKLRFSEQGLRRWLETRPRE